MWVKLDDHFPDHRKLAELGDYAPLCGWLYVCGLAFCNRQLTDGRIPKAHIHRLASFRHISIETASVGPPERPLATFGDDVAVEEIAEMLVTVRLWEDDGDAYVVHDYGDYQPSKADIERLEKQRKEGGKKGAQSRWGGRGVDKPTLNGSNSTHGSSNRFTHGSTQKNGSTHGSTNSKTIAQRCPVPVPGTDPDPGTPPNPPHEGGESEEQPYDPPPRRKMTRAERKWAEETRRKCWGRCPHDPPCPAYEDCLMELVVERRGRQHDAEQGPAP